MYIIRNKLTKQYLTRDGWTPKGTNLLDLSNALPFTNGEAKRVTLPSNQEFIRYKFLQWRFFK